MDISSGTPSHSANTTQISLCVAKPLFICTCQGPEPALTLHLVKQGSGGWWSLGCQRWRGNVAQEMQYKDGWVGGNKCRGLKEWTSGNSLRTTSIFWGLQLLWAQSITLGQGKCHGSGMTSAPLVRPALSSISALLLPHEASQAVLGAACSLLGWVWRTVSTPKAMLMDRCLCSNAKILKLYQNLVSGGRKL